jgi:amino acid transporter
MTALMAGCLWVLAATVTALLPMRRQMAPGLVLLLSAPVLVVWMSLVLGWWVGVIAVLAFLSMFRRPLGALLNWSLGREVRR